MDGRVAVQLVHQPQQFAGGGFGRQAVHAALDAGVLARLLFIADVNLAGRIVAHQHGRQARSDAGLGRELGGPLGNLAADLLGHSLPVENRSGHGVFSLLPTHQCAMFNANDESQMTKECRSSNDQCHAEPQAAWHWLRASKSAGKPRRYTFASTSNPQSLIANP